MYGGGDEGQAQEEMTDDYEIIEIKVPKARKDYDLFTLILVADNRRAEQYTHSTALNSAWSTNEDALNMFFGDKFSDCMRRLTDDV